MGSGLGGQYTNQDQLKLDADNLEDELRKKTRSLFTRVITAEEIIGKGSQIHSPYTISSATTTTATTFKRERNNVQSTTILQSRNRQNYIRDRSKQKLDESEM